MRKFLGILFLFLVLSGTAICSEISNDLKMSDVVVYSENERFGLKTKTGECVTKAVYKKLIRIGNGVWLIQKKNKFGLMNSNGKIIVHPKYRHAERVFGKFAKLGNDKDYGLYDENGTVIIPQEYSSIDPLFGKMFLIRRNYRYGVVVNYEGKKLLNNEFEDIYMPNSKVMRVKYEGDWYEIERAPDKQIELPENVKRLVIDDKEFTVTKLVASTGAASGYSVVTTTDYALKLFSSISPAYEETIDELMLSQGAETVSIFMKLSWLPKFPFAYAKNYYSTLKNPFNGPLNKVKSVLKKQM